jgi:Effector-associated domain 11
MNSTFPTHVRDLIGKNKLPEALQLLRDLLKSSPQLNRIVLQQRRFAEITQEKTDGLLKYEDAHVETNRIALAILDFLRDIEAEPQNPLIRAEVAQFERGYFKNALSKGTVIQNATNIYNIDKIDTANFS